MFLDLGYTPLANSYVKKSNISKPEANFPLCAYVCRKCFLVQIDEEEKPENIFTDYAYFSSYSKTWLQHTEEFADELKKYGRIYMYRYRPDYEIKSRHFEEFPHKSKQAAGIMMMLSNNLDYDIAQYPHELITYGGNGAVFQNWAQYRLTMKYLSEMTDEQTLVMNSGHPQGLFPSHKSAPRRRREHFFANEAKK